MLDEIWKDVKGYEGLYKVSNRNRLLALARQSADGKQMRKERMVASSACTYLSNHDHERLPYPMLNIVIDTFEIEDPLSTVIYKNGNKKDWSVKNITFLTKEEGAEPGEEWLPLKGYEDIYLISTHGRIWRLPRFDRQGHFIRARFVKVRLSNGQVSTSLCDNGKNELEPVWRLMANTFCETASRGVFYIDGNVSNLKLTNLVFVEQYISSSTHNVTLNTKAEVSAAVYKQRNAPYQIEPLDKIGFGYYVPSATTVARMLGLKFHNLNHYFKDAGSTKTTDIIRGCRVTRLKKEKG